MATAGNFHRLPIENRADGARHQWRVHDRAVHYGVLRQRLEPKTNQLVALLGLFQFDGFDRTRSDIQPDQGFPF